MTKKTRRPKTKSKFEQKLLRQLKKAKVNFGYEDSKISYRLPTKNYVPDFTVRLAGGRTIFLEGKGYLDLQARWKMEAVRADHPELDIRFIFMDASKKVGGRKITHGEWATEKGFLWANGEIPKEWLKE